MIHINDFNWSEVKIWWRLLKSWKSLRRTNWLQKYKDVNGKVRPIEKNLKIRKRKPLSKNPSKIVLKEIELHSRKLSTTRLIDHVCRMSQGFLFQISVIILDVFLRDILIFLSPEASNIYSLPSNSQIVPIVLFLPYFTTIKLIIPRFLYTK